MALSDLRVQTAQTAPQDHKDRLAHWVRWVLRGQLVHWVRRVLRVQTVQTAPQDHKDRLAHWVHPALRGHKDRLALRVRQVHREAPVHRLFAGKISKPPQFQLRHGRMGVPPVLPHGFRLLCFVSMEQEAA
jgi:hypothetical protein